MSRLRGTRVALFASALVLWLPALALAEVEIEARLGRSSLAVGESTTLEVVVRGASLGNEEPRVSMPVGIELLGRGREQSFQWVNGKTSQETVFRYEISPDAAGHFTIGPIDVTVGGQTYRSGVVSFSVTAAPVRVGSAGGGPASLVVELLPASPYVGQLAILRVRLVQRSALAEDPQYSAPATPGFWTDKTSAPESFYGDQGNQRVLVTETRTRLYPLAVGPATIGPAAASLVVVSGGASDPLAWFTGGARRQMIVRSDSLHVRVRPLPAGAPAGFTGAVGTFDTQWSSDRLQTASDVPVTIRLDVRGGGNLPLIRPPTLDDDDFEVFASTVDDSLGASGGSGVGRKRFQWTVLPKHQGTLELRAPAFAWFDPQSGSYHSAAPTPLELAVGPALFAGGTSEGFPEVFAGDAAEPGARGPEPWAYALAGLFAGVGIALWRLSLRKPPDSALRARQLEWLRTIGRGTGADFWRAAEEASAWLAEQRAPIGGLREKIAAARYSGGASGAAAAEPYRRALVEHLSRAMPKPARGLPMRVGAVALLLAACVWGVLFGPHAASSRAIREARAADRAARSGDLAQARATWQSLWRESGPHPGLAARLAWVAVQAGEIGPAAAWILRGQETEPRDHALGWVAERVREGGGLVGATQPRLPLTRLEWSVLAALLGLAAGVLWPRRAPSLACAALALLAGAVYPAQGMIARHSGTAVVVRQTSLGGSDLELQPGQIVTVTARSHDRARVRAGRDDSGVVPAAAVETVYDDGDAARPQATR